MKNGIKKIIIFGQIVLVVIMGVFAFIFRRRKSKIADEGV